MDAPSTSVRGSISHSLALLNSRDRRLLWLSTAIQMVSSLLDLAGVLLLGLVGALAVTTIQSQPPPEFFANAANLAGVELPSPQMLVIVLAALAAAILLFKSAFSALMTRRVFTFLANRQALVSARLAKELLSRPLTFLQDWPSQRVAYALIQGAGSATVTLLGQLVVALTEVALLVVLAVALLFVSPTITLASIGFFAVVALLLQRAMGNWAARVGRIWTTADMDSLNTVQEALAAYREITVSDRRALYVERFQGLRWQAAQVSAESTFIGMLPKYLFEGALVLGGLALAGFLFATQDATAAVAMLALYLAAGSRVMPSILRLQSSMLTMRNAGSSAYPTFELADALDRPTETLADPTVVDRIQKAIALGHPGFTADVSVQGVSMTYLGAPRPAIRHISFKVPAGSSLGLVGSSGAGKSTLADVLLGIITPDAGEVLIGGVSPNEARATWPGGVAYVPQAVAMANATVRSNVALGLPREIVDDERVWRALEQAHLADYLHSSREGLDTMVGESGLRLSGGQRQRLGLARALYTQPKLIVLDEATSALDADTEAALTETISSLEGSVTLIVIAHRLSTVRDLDNLLFLDKGSLIAQGTFAALRKTVPDLDRQARLMGL